MRPKGFKGFILLTIGQLVSISGSAMTQFGLGIWMWEKTGNATPFSMITVAFFLSNVLFSTFGGSLVDRLPRKTTLILPDLASGIITCITLILYLTNRLTLPFLYISSFFSGIFNAIQTPAYSVTMTAMLQKEEYGKANGLFSLTQSAPNLIAPILAGALIGVIGLEGMMVIDIVTFLFAISMVMLVDEGKTVSSEVKGIFKNILKDSISGFQYIAKRKGLLAILLIFLTVNGAAGFLNTLLSPMILAKFNDSSVILGWVQTVFGAGSILGGLIMSIWGGTKKKVYTVLSGVFLLGVGSVFLGISYSLIVILTTLLIIGFFVVLANASSQSISQSIVPIELQGRVFSAMRFISSSAMVVSMAISGPLVDKVLYRYFVGENLLTHIFGVGKSASMGFLITVAGIIVVVAAIVGSMNPLVLSVEDIRAEEDKEMVRV
ncbi:MAG: MFS transporter [Candidatus Atribacteria bacterium]|nr:MFS transporter [Candidatus Atribacteria bacterium]